MICIYIYNINININIYIYILRFSLSLLWVSLLLHVLSTCRTCRTCRTSRVSSPWWSTYIKWAGSSWGKPMVFDHQIWGEIHVQHGRSIRNPICCFLPYLQCGFLWRSKSINICWYPHQFIADDIIAGCFHPPPNTVYQVSLNDTPCVSSVLLQ